MIGSLKRVLMHRPGPELGLVTAATVREFNFARPVDTARFVADYDAMLGAFRGHGVETLLLREVLATDDDAVRYIDHRPNMTYTRDLATVFRHGAVLMGPHLKGRWGDQAMMGRAFTRLGVPILGAIEAPGFLEGGGVTLIGDDTAVASLCDRANQEGTRAIENRAGRAEQLKTVSYEEALREKVIVGTPDQVVARLKALQAELGLDGILAEMNCGAMIPHERVMRSLELLCKDVMPRLRH